MSSVIHRNICDITVDVESNWRNVHDSARPYLDAMYELTTIHDSYGCESGRSILLYFLCNALTWRGEEARRIKKELNNMLKEPDHVQ